MRDLPDLLLHFGIAVVPVPDADDVLALSHADRATAYFGPFTIRGHVAIVTPRAHRLSLVSLRLALVKLIANDG